MRTFVLLGGTTAREEDGSEVSGTVACEGASLIIALKAVLEPRHRVRNSSSTLGRVHGAGRARLMRLLRESMERRCAGIHDFHLCLSSSTLVSALCFLVRLLPAVDCCGALVLHLSRRLGYFPPLTPASSFVRDLLICRLF